MASIQPSHDIELLRLDALLARVPLSKASVYRLASAGKFPRPIRLTENVSCWVRAEVEAWISAAIISSRPDLAVLMSNKKEGVKTTLTADDGEPPPRKRRGRQVGG